jgi:hypothetical protein
VAHACNPSYLGGSAQENRGSKPAQAHSSRDPISEQNGPEACKYKVLNPNSRPTKKKKKKERNVTCFHSKSLQCAIYDTLSVSSS